MAAVTITFPGVQPSINQKSDGQSVPSGQEDLWVNADDMNELGQFDVVLSLMSRLHAMVTATVAGGANGIAVRLVGINGSSGLAAGTTSIPADLNKVWAAFIEKIEQGGDLDGTASGGNCMGVKHGLISGTFTTGTLYGLSAGGFFTYAGGTRAPIAIGLNTTYAYVDLGGRILSDNSTIEFTAGGVLQIKSGAQLTLGDTTINGTLDVSGNVVIDTGDTGRELRIRGTAPTMQYHEDDGNANENFQIRIEGGKYLFQINNDAFSSASNIIEIDQSGNLDLLSGSLEIGGTPAIDSSRQGALVNLTLEDDNGIDGGDGNAADQDIYTVDEGSADANRPRVYWDDALQSFAFTKPIISPTEESKSYSLVTGSTGVYYSAGWYNWPTTDANLDQGSLTTTLGTALASEAAHVGIVAGGAGVVDTGVVGLRATGITITDAGVRATGQTVVISSDITTLSLNQYVEIIKFLGVVTLELFVVSGSPVNFSLDFNYGLSKYEDFINRDFTVKDLEIIGRAGANDTGFDLALLHHKATGWTYAAAGFVPGAAVLAQMSTDHGTERQLITGEYFAYKKTGIDTSIAGDNGEGLILRTTTTANNAVQEMDLHIGININP